MAEKQSNHINGFTPKYFFSHKGKKKSSSYIPVLLPLKNISRLSYCFRHPDKIPSVFMASVNGEQCKVLDIKFHAFRIPIIIFFNPPYTSVSQGSLDRVRNESAFKKLWGEEEEDSEVVFFFNSSKVEC